MLSAPKETESAQSFTGSEPRSCYQTAEGPALFPYSEISDDGVEPAQEKTALIAEESKHEWKQIRFTETTWN